MVAAPKEPIKVFDPSPVTTKPVQLLEGRYGPYLTDGETNASLPRGTSPDEVTFEYALNLLKARAEMGPSKKSSRKKAAPKAAKKPTKKTVKNAVSKDAAAPKKVAKAKKAVVKKCPPKRKRPRPKKPKLDLLKCPNREHSGNRGPSFAAIVWQ